MKNLIPALALILATFLPASAQETVEPTATLLPLQSHESCEATNGFVSFLKIDGEGLPLTLTKGAATGAAVPATIRVRRGSEVSTTQFGFKRTTPTLTQPDPALPQFMDLVIEAVLCQSRTMAAVTVGSWSIRSSGGDFRLLLNGDIPSDVVAFPAVSYNIDEEMLINVVISESGPILAEDNEIYTLSASFTIPVSEVTQ